MVAICIRLERRRARLRNLTVNCSLSGKAAKKFRNKEAFLTEIKSNKEEMEMVDQVCPECGCRIVAVIFFWLGHAIQF